MQGALTRAFGAAVITLAVLWIARVVLQSLPIAYYRSSSAIPLVHSSAQALAFVQRSLIPYGGMPGDAQLVSNATERMVMQPDATFSSVVSAQDEYIFRWEARGAIAGPDAIVAIVDDAPIQQCLNANCTHYRITYGLHLNMLERRWRPAFVRAFANWWAIVHARTAPRPIAVESNCGNGRLNLAALRRVIGSVSNSDIYLHGADRRPTVIELSAIARFKPYVQNLSDSPGIFIAAAYTTDQPQGPRRGLEIYEKLVHPLPPPPNQPKNPGTRKKNIYHWLHFDTADNEPICLGRTQESPAPSSTRTTETIDVVADARYRLWDHISNAERFRVKLSPTPTIATSTIAKTRTVKLDWPTDRGTWHATYTYDAVGVLTQTDVQRRD